MKNSIIIAVATTIAFGQAHANLLLTNPDYDALPSGDQFFPDNATISGWTLTDAGGFGGYSNDQNNIGTPNFAYSGGGSNWTTTAGDRATVAAGAAYTFSYSGRLDGVPEGRTGSGLALIDWFDSSSSLIGSTVDFGSIDFLTTTRATNTADVSSPFGDFAHSVTAPVNATSAGVRWGTGSNEGVIADNFSLVAIPEPSGFALLVSSLGGLCLRRRRA